MTSYDVWKKSNGSWVISEEKCMHTFPRWVSFGEKLSLKQEILRRTTKIIDKRSQFVQYIGGFHANEVMMAEEHVDNDINMGIPSIHPSAALGMKIIREEKISEVSYSEIIKEMIKSNDNVAICDSEHVCNFQNVSMDDNPECEVFHSGICWDGEYPPNKGVEQLFGEMDLLSDEEEIDAKPVSEFLDYTAKRGREHRKPVSIYIQQ